MRLNLQSDYALRLLKRQNTNEGLPVIISEPASYCGTFQIHIANVSILNRKSAIKPIGRRPGNMRLVQWGAQLPD